MAASKLTIGYWNIKGLAAPLRAMAMFAGKEFENVAYSLVDKPDGSGFDASSWFGSKAALKEQNALMNLPYIIDPDTGFVISQSNACMSYLGRKFGLWGKTEAEISECEQLLCEVMDLRNNMTRHVYSPAGSDKAASEALVAGATSGNGILQKLELWLGTRAKGFSAEAPFLVGGHATAPDFHLWEMLDQYSKLAEYLGMAPLLANFPKLATFYAAFPALPSSKKYHASALHTALPFNNLSAGFGSTLSGAPYSATKQAVPNSSGVY